MVKSKCPKQLSIKTIKMISYEYFQKSKAFIYPALSIPKNIQEPLETYLGIENFNFKSTTPLVCMYNRHDLNFKKSLTYLKEHDRYELDFELEDFHIIIFDMSHILKDYNLIIAGSYSQVSENLRTIINLTFPKNKLIVLAFEPEKNRVFAEKELMLEPGALIDQEICTPPKMTTEGEILYIKDLSPLNRFYNLVDF